jgi:hypothetical protein
MEALDKLIKVLKSNNSFQYPVISKKNGYLLTLKEKINEYVKIVQKIEEEFVEEELAFSSKAINEIGQKIIKVIKLYLSGDTRQAHEVFSVILNDNRKNLENLILRFESQEEIFYRVRYSEKEITSKDEIFHIPFNLRHLVETMRYSISGIPCLYFGNTIYDCWLEMDKPDLNKLYISKFKNTSKINILDFAITFHTLNKVPTIEDQYPESYSKAKMEAFLALYPLILACSFKKQYENAKFNVEYIIPNILLQWISSEKEHIDGIRYFSTKMMSTAELNSADFRKKYYE